MKIKILTLGSDPEFFVLDPKGNPYPATNFAIGTKMNPEPIRSLGSGFFEQRDNVSFEGNIPPASTKEEFITYLTQLKEYFRNKVSEFGYSISNNGVEYFPKRLLELPEANEFGCSSVISGWDSSNSYQVVIPTPSLDNCKFRVSGFHIHIGYDITKTEFRTDEIKLIVVRLFDLFLSILSQIIKPEPERIKTYGRWGMFRSKSYGVECRTLSSFFTQPEYLPWVWDQVMKIEDFINQTSEEDLSILINWAHITGDTIDTIEGVFKFIFSRFTNTEYFSKFPEITRLYDK